MQMIIIKLTFNKLCSQVIAESLHKPWFPEAIPITNTFRKPYSILEQIFTLNYNIKPKKNLYKHFRRIKNMLHFPTRIL